jgi:glutamate racemase
MNLPAWAACCLAALLVPRSEAADPPDPVAPMVAHVQAHRDGRAAHSIDFAALAGTRAGLPIGVFDSGIGGLTVLEAILKLDAYHNQTLQPGPDGVPDFDGERFIYFGDQANMPYGNYPAQGREAYLKELIVKDAVFLLGKRYHRLASSEPLFDKPPVKAIVIACNTATAYGLEEIRGSLRAWGLEDVPIIGVVEAGARAVAAELPDDQAARTVAVLATVGTCASNAYPKAIGGAVGRSGKRVPVVVQQGSVGLAGAIEGNQAFIGDRAEMTYLGPAMENPAAPLDPALLPAYGFDPAGLRGEPAQPSTLRLTSVRNYVRYDVTTLLRRSPPPVGAPIEVVVLGCTHFPMAQGELADAFEKARAWRDADGAQPFAAAVSEKLRFVDPAQATAKELFRELARTRLRSRETPSGMPCQFFLSVPNPQAPGVKLGPDGSLETAYKHGRPPGAFDHEDAVVVPLRSASLPAAVGPLVRSLSAVWERLSAAQ